MNYESVSAQLTSTDAASFRFPELIIGAADPLAPFLGVGMVPLERACLLIHKYNLSTPEACTHLDSFRRLQIQRKRINFLHPWIYPNIYKPPVDSSCLGRTENFRQLLWALLSMVGSESLIIQPNSGVDPLRLVRVVPDYETLGMELLVCHLHSTEVKRVSFPPDEHGLLSQTWVDIMDVRIFRLFLLV